MSKRLYSLDALRGFDMFWIIGAEEIFHTMSEATHHQFWNALSNQFTHPVWDGFHAYDLIFPLFMFISGISSVYSIDASLEHGANKSKLIWKKRIDSVYPGYDLQQWTCDKAIVRFQDHECTWKNWYWLYFFMHDIYVFG